MWSQIFRCNPKLNINLLGRADQFQVADYGLRSIGFAGNPDPSPLPLGWRQAELLKTADRTKVETGNQTATPLHGSRWKNHDLELYGRYRIRLAGIDFHPRDDERAGKWKLQ